MAQYHFDKSFYLLIDWINLQKTLPLSYVDFLALFSVILLRLSITWKTLFGSFWRFLNKFWILIFFRLEFIIVWRRFVLFNLFNVSIVRLIVINFKFFATFRWYLFNYIGKNVFCCCYFLSTICWNFSINTGYIS